MFTEAVDFNSKQNFSMIHNIFPSLVYHIQQMLTPNSVIVFDYSWFLSFFGSFRKYFFFKNFLGNISEL